MPHTHQTDCVQSRASERGLIELPTEGGADYAPEEEEGGDGRCFFLSMAAGNKAFGGEKEEEEVDD